MSGYQEYHCNKCGLDWEGIPDPGDIENNCPDCKIPANISTKDSSILRIRELCDEAIDHDLSWNAFCHRLLERIRTEQILINPSTARATIVEYSKDREKAALALIDGAYDIIELYQPESPYNKLWRERWLKKAKELGANPLW